jgi:hypothetical protein
MCLNRSYIIMFSALTLLNLSCSKEKDSSRSSAINPGEGVIHSDDSTTDSTIGSNNAVHGQGCIQGVVIDGYTGQPIPFKDYTKDLFVMIRTQKYLSSFVDDPNFVGQYYLCGIPLDETYPIYGFIPGYQIFESSVHIKSTAPAVLIGEGGLHSHVKKKDPLLIANVVLFPKTVSDRDLTIYVFNEGLPVADAIVDIEPNQSSSNHFTNTVSGAAFIYSNGTRNFTTRVKTNAQGIATIKGSEMAMGHPYGLTITPDSGRNLTSASLNFIFGINGPELAPGKNNYEYNIDLADISEPLKVISCSVQNSSFSNDSSISIVFNRDIQPVSQNLWSAALSGHKSNAVIHDNVSTTPGSEEVNGTVTNGNALKLTAKFKSKPRKPDYSKAKNDPANQDIDAEVRYTDIKVNVVGDDTQNHIAITNVDPDKLCFSSRWHYRTRLFKEYE